jgi:hypothetical protein
MKMSNHEDIVERGKEVLQQDDPDLLSLDEMQSMCETSKGDEE